MENLVQDVRLALRALRRNPGFGTAALLTLALGIGGTCAVFSVVNDIYLRPLPFAHEDRLLRLRDSTRTPGGAIVTVNTNAPHFLEIAAQTRTLSGLSAQLGRSATLTGADLPAHVDEALLSPGSLAVLGVQPVLGRGFSKDEEQQGEGAGVALISANLWHARLGGDAQALGRTIEVDGRPLRVVGVLPPGYRFPYDADVWLPLRLADAAADDFAVFARMAPGATLGEVRAELDSIASRMPGRDSRTLPGYGIEAVPLRKSLLADEDRVAVALLAVLAFFLLLACVDVAMLLLARSASRQKEFAIRGALGATPLRQARQLLTESAVLALFGGAIGLWLAFVARPALDRLVPGNLSHQLGMQQAPLDFRVLAFTFVLATVTAALAGLLPAAHAARADLESVLRVSAPGAAGGRRRLLGFFVAGQIALGVVLLCGAGLVVENFRLLRGSRLGFDPAGLYTAELSLPQSRYAAAPARAQLVAALGERLGALAGIEGAAITSVNPLRGGTWSIPVTAAAGREGESQSVNHRLVSPGLFAAMRIPLLRGRDFSSQDGPAAERVAVVSQRLAARLWRGADALGRKVRIARQGSPWLTVVGVAGDVRDAGDLDEAWYLPYAQNAASPAAETLNLMLRSPLPAEALARGLRSAVASLDPLLSLDAFAGMEQVRAESLAPDRLGAATVSLFGLLGLLLAAVGTYGVLAYALERRRRELGIRLALGAAPRDVLSLVLGEGMRLATLGVLAGLCAALVLQRALARRLPEAAGANPLLFAAVALLFLLLAAAASFLPGRRAMRTAPAVSLRAE